VEKLDAPGVQRPAGKSMQGRGEADVGRGAQVDGPAALTRERGGLCGAMGHAHSMWGYPAWDAERQLEELQVRGRVPGGATRSGAFRASGERIAIKTCGRRFSPWAAGRKD